MSSQEINDNSYSTDDITYQCQQWVETFIIKYGICPFAKSVFEDSEVEFQVVENDEFEEQAIALMTQVERMKSSNHPETALLIFPYGLSNFLDFLSLLDVCNQLLEQQQDLDFIQLASFHPNYLFEGEDDDSASHYTNRSPWPMIHLIRQQSISDALQNFPNPEEIPKRNIKLMEQLGLTNLRNQLSNICINTDKN